jgi:hypothetical protein
MNFTDINVNDELDQHINNADSQLMLIMAI